MPKPKMPAYDSRSAIIFRKNLQKLRKSHGYTLLQMAEFCDVAESAISRYENGLLWPRPDTIDKIADMYAIAIADLFSPGGAEGKAYSIKATQENKLDWINAELNRSGFKLVRTS